MLSSHLDRFPEPDIINVDDEWPALAVHVGVGPGQLKGLPHDKSTENFVEPADKYIGNDLNDIQF